MLADAPGQRGARQVDHLKACPVGDGRPGDGDYTRGGGVGICAVRSLCCLWVAPPALVTRSGGFLIGGFFFEPVMVRL